MHRALAIPDVLLHIVFHVEAKDTLAALARTSRLVSGCALDKLWHTIDSVVLLARCMPPDIWDEVETCVSIQYGSGVATKHSSQLSLSDNLQEGDWLGPRFNAYAKRIRHLSTAERVADREKWPVRRSSWMPSLIDHPKNPDALPIPAGARTNSVTSAVHLDVLRAWCSYSRSVAPIFPNLSHIQWAINDPDDSELAPLLLVPPLSSLTLQHSERSRLNGSEWDILASNRATAAAVLQEAMARCSSLASVALHLQRGYGRGFDPSQRTPIMDSVTTLGSRLQHLRTFCCNVLAPSNAVRHLASLPCLEVFDAPVSEDVSLAGLPRVFPMACKLCFWYAPVRVLCVLVAAVQSARVHTLKLGVSDEPSPRLVGELFMLVAALPSACALRQFSFASDRSRRVTGPVGYLALHDLRPLMCLSSLRDVAMRGYAVKLVEDTVARMLDAWPALERLELACGSEITLGQLLLAACRNGALCELVCTVVARVGAPLLDTRGLVNTGLQHLDFAVHGEDEPAERAALAHLLVTVFPSLSSLGGRDWNLQTLVEDGHEALLSGTPWALHDYEAAAKSQPPN